MDIFNTIFVFDESYVSTEDGPTVPFINEVYVYVFDEHGNVFDALKGLSSRNPEPGREITYVARMIIMKGASAVDVKYVGKAIIKAEYETWHAFNKA